MKKILLSILFTLMVLGPCFSLEGTVITVTGKVESQVVGGNWKSLNPGDTVSSGTIISTGFKSEATVQLGASILTLKPLTRMTLTELVEREDVVDTELYLEVGNVKAEVNSFNNKRNGFTVKSPVATASVRGTIFELGEDLVVSNGSVSFVSPIGQVRVAIAGEELQVIGQAVANPVVSQLSNLDSIPLSATPSTENTSIITTNSVNTVDAKTSKETTAEKPIASIVKAQNKPSAINIEINIE